MNFIYIVVFNVFLFFFLYCIDMGLFKFLKNKFLIMKNKICNRIDN